MERRQDKRKSKGKKSEEIFAGEKLILKDYLFFLLGSLKLMHEIIQPCSVNFFNKGNLLIKDFRRNYGVSLEIGWVGGILRYINLLMLCFNYTSVYRSSVCV